MNTPRKAQLDILQYRSGRMGVSAVPGSGKTFTLSMLAAGIITRQALADDQEVLIVTLVNSAVDNFTARIGSMIGQRGFFPNLGYRVRTLHGLAHDIVRGRPALVGLEEGFKIVDEQETEQIRQEAALDWLHTHPSFFEDYLEPSLDANAKNDARLNRLPRLVKDIALNFIRSAKDAQITPRQVRECLDALPLPLPLAEMGAAIYADYQRSLDYRGAVDFDDLIRLALDALRADDQYLQRLRHNFPFILEDEAQDSSRLQEEILKLLAGESGNWVRVGDPNQAIYETFTTASPRYLREFIHQPAVRCHDLPESGRSSPDIIALANHLVDWTMASHPLPEARDALGHPYIQPTSPGDPQANPAGAPNAIRIVLRKLLPADEITLVAGSIGDWMTRHPHETAAVLCPRNKRAVELTDELRRRGLDFVEILHSTSATRLAAGALANVVKALADPQDGKKLAIAYQVWRRASRQAPEDWDRVLQVFSLLKSCRHIETFLWPQSGDDWLVTHTPQIDDYNLAELAAFRDKAQRWHGAAFLPIDQAILTLAQDLFTEPADLAVAHKLAVVLRQSSRDNTPSRLPVLTKELEDIAKNNRRFIGLGEDDTGFDPSAYPGKVVVTTIHKAKGLEWDRVYLLSVNNYDFPSGAPGDQYISEPFYLRRRLNLPAESLEQLRLALGSTDFDWYQEGAATIQARHDYVSERLRLLYVGITRARKELIITWNNGQRGDCTPSLATQALDQFLRDQQTAATEEEYPS